MTVSCWIFICILGLCWGSFLNVLILRSLSGESIIHPASKCPKCDVPLQWWQNIPIVSYFLLSGRCYYCKKPISIMYPIVEILGLVIFIFAFSTYASVYDAIAAIGILSMFLTLAITDMKIQKVSTIQSLLVILFALLFNRHNIFNAIMGGLIGVGIIILLTQLGLKLFKKETFGFGDIFLLGALGTLVGFDRFFLYIIYVLFIQILFILPNYVKTLYITKQIDTLKYLAFFVTTCLFLYVLKGMVFWGVKVLYIAILAGMLFYAYKLAKMLVNSLRFAETHSYCPFAPAIAIVALLFLI